MQKQLFHYIKLRKKNFSLTEPEEKKNKKEVFLNNLFFRLSLVEKNLL